MKSMTKAKKVTIETLARMSQKEFASIGERFDGVEKQLQRNTEDIGLLRRDVEAGFQSVGEVLKLMREDLKEIKEACSPSTKITPNCVLASIG